MLLAPRQFVRLLDGRLGHTGGRPLVHAVLLHLPGEIASLLGGVTHELRIGVEYARKVVFEKHGLTYEEFFEVESLIRDGWCFAEKRHHLTFMGYPGARDRPYTLVIKSARNGTEAWLVTFHRTNAQQMRTKIRRAMAQGQVFRRPPDEPEG